MHTGVHTSVILLTLWRTLGLLTGLPEMVPAESLNQRECKTYGSGVVQPFNGSAYHVRTSCSVTLLHFTHLGVDCDITIQRGLSGLLTRVEVVVNKIRTVVQDETIVVESHRVSLPYDHTYQHVFRYGVHTRLRSKVLPLTVTWHDTPLGIDSLWVRLEGNSISGMRGLCGRLNTPANPPQLISEAVLEDDTCVVEDSLEESNMVCGEFMSHAWSCLASEAVAYFHLCGKNAYGHADSSHITCPFFWDIALRCGPASILWNVWREVTQCPEPQCPGQLTYKELGNAFIPTCSKPTPTPRASDQDMTSTCVCPQGQVLNERASGHSCVSVEECPCVYGNSSYPPGSYRRTKCQTCNCVNGKWQCSEDICPKTCSIESQFVTSFDGKHFRLPGKCTYVAAQGLNWTLTVHFSERAIKLQTIEFNIYHESFTFFDSRVMFQNEEIRDFHQTALVTVFWQSSMYVQVQVLSGLSIQVQMSPEIQVYVSLAEQHSGTTEGLCGNFNGDSSDDFTTSSGIVENSAEPFALSWSVESCVHDIPDICTNVDNEIFADEHCNQLRDPNGIFGSCHSYVPYDQYYQACISKTCQCHSELQSCLCVALGNYAKACASVGAFVGDWRTATNCTVTCMTNQVFDYTTRVCNRTCRSLAGRDPTCDLEAEPAEGCGCREGTYLNDHSRCSPQSQCQCHHKGGATPPGPMVIDGRACNCEDGKLNCSEACVCKGDKVCVHCAYFPINTAQKTCDSLNKPVRSGDVCHSGCYCPEGQYEDHNGVCVSAESCTCVFSGRVYSPGESVESNCKTCTCGGGQWYCTGEPCPGKCQVFGNGHYQTFDSKWLRFDGNCQYTLVEDDCGSGEGAFAVRVESIPCCDEELTCSRTITVDLLDKVSLVLGDMSVRSRYYNTSAISDEMLYSVHTVGLYILITAPRLGLTLIWDKHTRLTVLLEARWKGRVCGLCGNFDSSEANDLLSAGSWLEFGNSWKTGTPPCSDVTSETFPCQRHSYCANWAERRCMIIKGDTFRECHLKVDPDPYYQACVLEACSCEFEGKFLGFCTAVAAYAEACSEQNVCIQWRTPDLCPVYCDYYNREGECSWHYDPCGKAPTCGRNYNFNGKLEGCYPRCPAEAPYYDENTENCTTLQNCTCLFNGTVLIHGTSSGDCACTNGTMDCGPYPSPTTPTTTTKLPTTTATPPTTTSTATPPTTTLTTTPPTTTLTTTPPTTTSTTTPPTTTMPSSTTTTKTSTTAEATTTNRLTTIVPTTTTVTTTTMAPTTTTAIVTTDWPTMEPTTTSSTTTPSTTPTTMTTASTMKPKTTSATTTARASTTTSMETTAALTSPTTVKPTTTTSSTSTTVETNTEYTELSTTAVPTTTTTTVEPSTSTISTTVKPTTEQTTTSTTPTTEPTTTATPFTTTFKPTTTRPPTEPTTTTATTSTTFIVKTGPTTTQHSHGVSVSHGVITTLSETTSSASPTTTTILPTTATTTTTTATSLKPTSLSTAKTTGPSTTTTTTPTSVPSTEPTTTTATTSVAVPTTSTLEATLSTSSTTIKPSTAATVSTTLEATTATTTTKRSTTTTPSTTMVSSPTTESTTTPGVTEPTTPRPSTITSQPTTTTLSTRTPKQSTSEITEATTIWSTTEEATATMVEITSVLSTSPTMEPTTTSTTTLNPTTAKTSTTTTMETTTTSTMKPTTVTLSTSTPVETTFETDESPTTALTPTTSVEPTTTATVPSTVEPTAWDSTTESFTISTSQSTTTRPSTTATTTATPVPTTVKSTTNTVQTTSTTEPTTATSVSTSTTTEPTTTTSASTTTTTEATTATSVSTTTTTEPTTATSVSTTTTTEPTTTTSASTTTTTEPTTATSVSTTSTTEPTTTTSVSTTTTMEPTTTLCQCRDVLRNESWMCGERWTEDCFNKECRDGQITMTQVTCPKRQEPVCPRGQVTRVREGCCQTDRCNCRCEVYGDPHYITFQGTTYDFLENCTYTLVQERLPQYDFSIMVDNYFCIPWLAGSCTKGIMMKFRNHTVSLSILSSESRVEATLNQMPVRPPYEEQGIRFETTGFMVSVYIEEIRSYVSLTPSNTLVITLAMEHFQNNTEGQCGECGGSSCVRPGGKRENDTCCAKTASDWIYPDPHKPYCASSHGNVPCDTLLPTPPPCKPPLHASDICEILRHPEFQPCGAVVNLDVLVHSCKSDVCLSGLSNMSCSVFAQAAEACKKAGFCVEWQHLTNGTCNIQCPGGMMYHECQGQLDDYCSGSLRVSGRVLEEMSSGCFCPEQQLRAAEHSDVCVDICTDCQGPRGEPKQPGDTWESSCAICTCDNQTRTTECHPRPNPPSPLCSPDSILVTGCCGVQTCVERTCQYKEVTYEVGDRWSDPSEKCVSFSCTNSGTLQEKSVCPQESCPEELRVWDEHHCCYTCNHTCALRLTRVNLTVGSCFTSVQLPTCEGQCEDRSRWQQEGGVLQLERVCPLCQESTWEERVVYLTCGHKPTPFNYRHITSCHCDTGSVHIGASI